VSFLQIFLNNDSIFQHISLLSETLLQCNFYVKN
jgi:hypothetical protein